jgi:hypothetical protein
LFTQIGKDEMGAANMGSAVEGLVKVIVGVGLVAALIFVVWIAYWIGWWVIPTTPKM